MARNNSVQASISTLLESLAEQVEALVRQSAFDQVNSALAGLGGGAVGNGRARRGRPKGSGRKPGRPAGSKNKVGRGGKRTSEGLDEMGAKLLAHVKANPGQRGEQIAKAMRSDVGTIRLPMKKLIAAKKVKTKGQRRGMTYAAA